MKIRNIVFMSVLTIATSTHAQQDCAAYVRDAFNISVKQNGVSSSSQFRRWQCTAKFSSHNEAIGSGLNVGVVLYGVPLQVGGNFSESQVSSWKEQNCSDLERSADYRQASYEFTKIFAPEAAELAKYCLDSQRPTALRCTLAGEGADKVFSATWFRSPGDNQAPVVQSFTVRGGACVNAPRRNGQVSDGGTLAICTAEEGKDLTVALETSRGSCFQNFAFNPTIAVVSGILSLSGPMTFAADVVDIRPDTKIVTNGHQLTLSAKRELRISGAPSVEAFDASSPTRRLHGRSAASISIQAPRVTGSQLTIANFGEDGLNGQPGSVGEPGRAGRGHHHRDLRGCGGGRGGRDGGPGRPGTRGGNGGAAGPVSIAITNGLDVAGNSRILVLTSRRLDDGSIKQCSGSCGGLPGQGGPGGPGGHGGRAGRGHSNCDDTSAGRQGPAGQKGENGEPGADAPVSTMAI